MAEPTSTIDPARSFELAVAVPLASCSFTAYTCAVEDQPGQSYKTKDTAISFLDRSFLFETFNSLLDIRVLRATKLRKPDIIIQPKAFAVVTTEWPSLHGCSSARRFDSITTGTDPVWASQPTPLRIPIRDLERDMVRVQLYDEAGWSVDDLGFAVLKLSDLIDKPEQELTVNLEGLGANKGVSTVTVSCRLRPLAQCTAEELGSLAAWHTTNRAAPAGTEATDGMVNYFSMWGAVSNNSMPAKNPDTWDNLGVLLGGEAADMLVPVAFLDNGRTDTQVWIFRNVEKRKLVLAFRGTEKGTDWLTNINIATCKPTSLIGSRPDSVGGSQILVHQGFFGAYMSVRKTCNVLVEIITGGFGQPANQAWRVQVTGHSLGGALATLSTYDLASQKWDYEQKSKSPSAVSLMVYTFGCPRVGNSTFATDLNSMVSSAWRITNPMDCVTSVPMECWFLHWGTAVQAGPNNNLMFDPQEASLPQKILSGAFITDHMELRYLESITKMVLGALAGSTKIISKV
ncbi:hypothetical protein Vretimale_17857 [Volvox reticuliferus]|uniref:Fungal lipase-like domain-containing protein n=1 Tax=Volvox reticuliferus TaxID=1737510 RepID=A0A8J4LYX6_9CHLO|nr:hypothetical protein Vretifemale_17697 [Volvox reticuliferus]GIM15098.1 hypothetical protein Vretimale_17857 [Volvox reticuliferus]